MPFWRGRVHSKQPCITKLILEVSWQKWINASHVPEEIGHSGGFVDQCLQKEETPCNFTEK